MKQVSRCDCDEAFFYDKNKQNPVWTSTVQNLSVCFCLAWLQPNLLTDLNKMVDQYFINNGGCSNSPETYGPQFKMGGYI